MGQWPSYLLGEHEHRADDGNNSRVLRANPLHSPCVHLKFTPMHLLNHARNHQAVAIKKDFQIDAF